MGWVTVVAYFVAAVLCWAAIRARGGESRELRRFWVVLTVLMCALGVNKQLDLQSALTDIGRWMAMEQGWYENRRHVQKAAIVVVALIGLTGLLGVVWLLKRWTQTEVLALVGLVSLVTFIVIRAASFHKVDLLIGSRILGARVNWILELGGIVLIAVAAARAAKLWPLRRGPGS